MQRNPANATAALQAKYGLYDRLWHIETLSYLFRTLCTYFDVPEIPLRVSNRFAIYKNGNFKFRYVGFKNGKISYESVDVAINKKGHTIGTILHEFSHHFRMCEKPIYASHKNPWQRIHYRVVLAYIGGTVVSRERMELDDELNRFWDKFPAAYKEFWHPGIKGKELLEKLRQLEAAVRGEPLLRKKKCSTV